MNTKFLLGTAAAIVGVTQAQTADSIVYAEPDMMDSRMLKHIEDWSKQLWRPPVHLGDQTGLKWLPYDRKSPG